MFPSYRFYHGQIASGDKENIPQIKGIEWPNKNVNAVFVNTQSREEFVGGSVANNR